MAETTTHVGTSSIQADVIRALIELSEACYKQRDRYIPAPGSEPKDHEEWSERGDDMLKAAAALGEEVVTSWHRVTRNTEGSFVVKPK